MSEWKDYKLGELFANSNQGVNTTTEKVKYSKDGIAVIRAKNIRQYKIDFNDVTYVDKNTYDKLKKTVKPQIGDILYTNIGSQLGNAAQVKSEKTFAIAWNVFRIVTNDELHSTFLTFLFNNPKTKDFIRSLDSSSTMPFVSGSVIRNLEFQIPPLPEQKAIAEVLSSLDDKIDLLHRQNITLEQITETIFRQWFVDFEFPNGVEQTYKLSGGTFQSSELGLIPLNWRVGQIMDLISILETGGRPKGGVGQYTSGIPSIGAENVKGIGKYDYSKTKYIPEEYFKAMNKGILTNRDILVYKDGGTPGTFIPHFSLVGEGFPYESMAINEHVFRVITKESYQQNYLFLWLNTKLVISELGERGTGAAIPGINSTEFKETVLLLPEDDILKMFNEQVEPLIHKILKNSCSIRTLEKMRNTLLPKLMSGGLVIDNK